ncbi:MAG: hypothetical protein H8M99_07250 [Gloeobacteraceae cyanobacterium ES-bin-144]|nr:hypothetical protein [Verrucomicrobiales bacterium]
MSLLPQSKKSPEEIARLREALGVPELVNAHEPNADSTTEPTITDAKKRTKKIAAVLEIAAPITEPEHQIQTPKPVRSLRKSEQIPILRDPITTPAANSTLPIYRHSSHEINELRRREAIAMLNPVANPRLATAHYSILTFGYLTAVIGASFLFSNVFPLAASASCVASALLVAAYIYQRRPISRHHAAFIAVIALFVIVFGALHYFPHLQNAT